MWIIWYRHNWHNFSRYWSTTHIMSTGISWRYGDMIDLASGMQISKQPTRFDWNSMAWWNWECWSQLQDFPEHGHFFSGEMVINHRIRIVKGILCSNPYGPRSKYSNLLFGSCFNWAGRSGILTSEFTFNLSGHSVKKSSDTYFPPKKMQDIFSTAFHSKVSLKQQISSERLESKMRDTTQTTHTGQTDDQP